MTGAGSKKLHMETRLLHEGRFPETETGATVPPLFQNTSFAYSQAEELEKVFAQQAEGYVYSRIANPTVSSFERRMTLLEDGLAAVACASGMAAISAAVLTLAAAGDEIVSSSSIFGGSYSLFKRTLKRFGIRVRFVESTDIDAYARAVNDRTRMFFVETIGNPRLDIPDIASLARVARHNKVALAVDNTAATPLLVQPRSLGADIVIHSTTKYINGHGNAVGGVVVDCGTFDWGSAKYAQLKHYHDRGGHFAFIAALRGQIYRDLGCCLAPFNAWLMSMSLDSLGVRMERHCANAAYVAGFLTKDGRVEDVRYPGLVEHPNHTVAKRQFGGRYGGVLTLRLGAKERAFRFINALKRAQNAANLGEARTLVIHPASTICRELAPDERKALGVTDDLVRFSIGLEHVEDILEDINEALNNL
jgi:O-acetylhomoserine (thiol)-lyase